MRFFSTSISIVLVSAFLTACGGGGSDAGNGNTPPG